MHVPVRNAFAELERNLISERTRAGMASAKQRGVVVLGRRRKLSNKQVLAAHRKRMANPNPSSQRPGFAQNAYGCLCF